MKNLDNYITERLKLTSKTYNYTCQPKDRNELRKILEERLKEDKNADLNDIDVSKITDMGAAQGYNLGLFERLDPHNIKINEWDVSNVTDMYALFYECKNLDCDLSNWNVSNVTNMNYMFAYCENFTGTGLENWDVSNVKYFDFTFARCNKFDCDLSNWNVNKAIKTKTMFYACDSLKNIPSWLDNN